MARIRGDIHRPGLHHGCPGYMRRRHRHGSMDPFQLLERTRPAGKGGGIDRRTGQAEDSCGESGTGPYQHEHSVGVTATLNSVIDQTISGLRMLDEAKAHGEEPSAESIASAFAAIGSQGREALAHMCQLLRVLRETGFSDKAHAGKSEEMRLKPAASLDEQMKSGFFRGMFQR